MITHKEDPVSLELEAYIRKYFAAEKKLSTIARRALVCSLVDFPITAINIPFIIIGILIKLFKSIFKSSEQLDKCANWLRHPKNRKGILARFLPPYQTVSARIKLKTFKHSVVLPLEKKYPLQFRSLDFKKAKESLYETVTSWEKIPNIMEYILTLPCWMLGIKFLGL